MYAQAVAGFALSAVAFGGGWMVNGWRMDTQLSQLKTEYATAQFNALEKAHAETIRLQAQADKAAKQHAARQSALADDAAGVRTALVGLSHAADAALRRAEDSHGTCLDRASALAVVFDQCSGTLGSVAEKADKHAIDTLKMLESWPSAQPGGNVGH